MTGPATFTIPQVADLLGLSRNAAYAQAGKGEIVGIVVLRAGRRMLVPAQPLLQLLGIPPSEDADGGLPNPFDSAGHGH